MQTALRHDTIQHHLVIGEAGESCAFHIARRLGMPEEMLRAAARAAYGEDIYRGDTFLEESHSGIQYMFRSPGILLYFRIVGGHEKDRPALSKLL